MLRGPAGSIFARKRGALAAPGSAALPPAAPARGGSSAVETPCILFGVSAAAMYGEEDKKLFGRSGRSEFFSALSRTTMQQKNKPPGGFVDSRSASSRLYSTAHKLERHVESRTPAVQKKNPSLEFLGDWRIDWVIGEFGVMFRCDKNIRIASGGIWLS